MLKIFQANTETAAVELALDELMKNNASFARHIIITPDRFSLSVEKKLFEYTALPGAFHIDVYSFTNFAKRAVKGLPKCLSKEGTVMLLREVLEAEEENLLYYKKSAKLKSFPKELFAVMASIRNSGITPDALLAQFSNASDTLSLKYRDIAHLYQRYQEALAKKYTDTTGRLDALIERADSLPEVTGSHFYLVGFFNFYKKQLQIIEAFVKSAKSVTIAKAVGHGANEFLFLDKLKQDAEEIRRRTGSELVFSAETRPVDTAIKDFAENVFSRRKNVVKSAENVVLFKENTPYDEIKAVAREISRLVRCEGYRYKDIAVVAYDESYKSVVKDIFARFDIPFFTDTKYPLKTAMSVRYFLSALQVISKNYKKSEVLSLVKNPLFPQEKEKTDAFENYVLKYNLDFNGFLSPFTRGKPEEFCVAEEVRQTIIQEIPDFSAVTTVSQAVEVAKAFFSTERLTCEAEKMAQTNDTAYIKLHEQAAELFLKQLEEMDELLIGKPIEIDTFKDMAVSAILSVSVSLIPMTNDCVFVGTGEESALYGIKALFLVGAAEGIVPKVGGYQAIMPEKDVLIFEKRGIPLYPTPIDRMKEEKAKLVSLILKAEKRFYASFAEFNLQSEQMTESEFLKELCAISGQTLVRLSDGFLASEVKNAQSAQNFLVTLDNALYEYLLWKGRGLNENPAFFNAVEEMLVKNNYPLATHKNLSETVPEGKTNIFFKEEDGQLYTSASQLERYAQCPYRHFLDYGLRIKERDEGEAKSADIGTILHRALEIYFKNTLGRLKKLTDTQILKEAERAIETAFRLERAEVLEDSRFGKILFRTLRKELFELLPRLTKAVQSSSFEPKFIEFSFGAKENNAILIETKFGKLFASGKIDRADVSGKDLFLIDYKTGNATSKLNELYEGRKIQLALYAIPFRGDGYRIVGSYYLPVKDGYRAGGHSLSLTGNTLDALSVVQALDNGYVPESVWESTFFPVKNKVTKARGAELSATTASRLLSEGDFLLLESMALGFAKNAAEEIFEGYAAKRPAKDACKYCHYAALCERNRERVSRTVKIENGMLLCDEGGEIDE